jgi:hypothetical protein
LTRRVKWRRWSSPFHHRKRWKQSPLPLSLTGRHHDSERNLEDDKDTTMEMLEDSPRLEWWEEAECKAEEEGEEMLEEQEALLESFATARKEERTWAVTTQAVHAKSSPCGHGHAPACPQFPLGRFAEVAQIWKAAMDRRKAFDSDASCSVNGEGAAAAVVVISSDEEE